MSRSSKRAGFAFAVLALGACTPASFQPQFTTPVAPTEKVVLERLATNKPREDRAVVVGVTADPQRLFAFDLASGKLLWERAAQLRSAPLVAADAIIAQEPAGVTVRDLATGDVRAVVDETGKLVGADGQGHTVLISIAYPEGTPQGAIACVDGSNVRWKRMLPLPVGVPALGDSYALVPWATQRLSVLTLDDGRELARWHFKHTVVGHALFEQGKPYVGQQGLLALDQNAVAHAGDEPKLFTPFKRALPGQPPLLRDGYLPIDEPDNAVHRLQVSWRPTVGQEGALQAQNDQLLLRFYRLLFALDARQDAVQWVRTFEHDLVGVALQPGGSLVADSEGQLRALDALGRTQASLNLGRKLRVAAIRPGAWWPTAVPTADASAAAQPAAASTEAAPAANAAAAQPAATDDEAPATTLLAQLVAAAALPDSRLSAGRAYAVELLARGSEPEITAHLIALCDDDDSPDPVQLEACTQLTQRTDGGPAVLAALERRASFMKDSAPPPLAALAPVAARMELRQAAPLLLAHLQDPATPLPALAPVISALEQLGHAPAAGPLERFVRMHHAEPDGSELAPAIDAALHALGALRVRTVRASLQAVANDGLAPATTRQKASAALAAIDAPPVNAKAAAAKPEAVAQVTPAVVADTRPYALSSELVRTSLTELRKPLAACLNADPSKPHSGRVSMVVNAAGEVEGVFVTPTSLQACVEPILRPAKLPATRSGRQRVNYEIKGANAESEPAAPAASKPEKKKPSAKR
jgi:hypothetical protein